MISFMYSNKKLTMICKAPLVLVSLFAQFLVAEQSSYNLEFDYISKVIHNNNTSIYPTEFWTLRDDYLEEKNAQNESELETQFNGLFDLATAIQAISKDPEQYLELAPQDKKEVYRARLDQLIEISETALLMEKDLWHEDYVNNLLKHVIGLRAAGISEKLPKFLWNPRINVPVTKSNFHHVRRTSTVAYDENFRRFGNLRSYLPGIDQIEKEKLLQPPPYQSIIWDLRQYMINENADENFIKNFAFQWSGDINKYDRPRAVKSFLINQRNLPPSSYDARSKFDGSLNDRDSKAIIILHAFTQEIIKNTWFRHQNKEAKSVRVLRALRLNDDFKSKITSKVKYTTPQGILSSVSIFYPIGIGMSIAVFEVPNHRILGLYFMEREAGSLTSEWLVSTTLFAADFENEFIAMLEGIPFEIVSLENLDLNGDIIFDNYVLNYYQKNSSLNDNSYASDNLNIMLATASSLGDIDAVRTFLELGANPNFKNKKDQTSIHFAAEQGNWDIINLLLNKGANLNAQDKWGQTPLAYAAENGHWAMLIYFWLGSTASTKNDDIL